MSCDFRSCFSCVQNAAAAFSSWQIILRRVFFPCDFFWLLPCCLFIFGLIYHEHERISWDKGESHTYREYAVGCTCFFAMVCVSMHEKRFFKIATSKAWTHTLELDSEKPWPLKTCTLKNLYPEKHRKQLDVEKSKTT